MSGDLGQIAEAFVKAAALPSIGKNKISFEDSEKVLAIHCCGFAGAPEVSANR